jgi:hypothetical protein
MASKYRGVHDIGSANLRQDRNHKQPPGQLRVRFVSFHFISSVASTLTLPSYYGFYYHHSGFNAHHNEASYPIETKPNKITRA